MTTHKLYADLCWYDRRNPNSTYLDDDSPKPRQPGCGCDACFYGRDRLAVLALELEAALRDLLEVAENAAREDRWDCGAFDIARAALANAEAKQ